MTRLSRFVALAQVQVAKGLKVEVWAAEPLLANPVSIAFDEKGCRYVAETTRFEHGVPMAPLLARQAT